MLFSYYMVCHFHWLLQDSDLGLSFACQRDFFLFKSFVKTVYMQLDVKLKEQIWHFFWTCSIRNAGLPQPLPVPHQVWTNISLDFMEGLIPLCGKDAVLVDHFSWLYAFYSSSELLAFFFLFCVGTPRFLVCYCLGVAKVEAVDFELKLRDDVLLELGDRVIHAQNLMKISLIPTIKMFLFLLVTCSSRVSTLSVTFLSYQTINLMKKCIFEALWRSPLFADWLVNTRWICYNTGYWSSYSRTAPSLVTYYPGLAKVEAVVFELKLRVTW